MSRYLCGTGVRVSTWVCACACGWVCFDVHGCAWVCVWVCSGVCVGVCGCVWDEFSEYLLETRVLTSADFNMYPI